MDRLHDGQICGISPIILANSLQSFSSCGNTQQNVKNRLCPVRYWLDGRGIESRWRRDFPRPFRPAQGNPQPPVQWVPDLFLGVKASGRGADHPPPSSAEVKKIIVSPLPPPLSASSWPVLGWPLPLPLCHLEILTALGEAYKTSNASFLVMYKFLFQTFFALISISICGQLLEEVFELTTRNSTFQSSGMSSCNLGLYFPKIQRIIVS